jgi:hypothetical protein
MNAESSTIETEFEQCCARLVARKKAEIPVFLPPDSSHQRFLSEDEYLKIFPNHKFGICNITQCVIDDRLKENEVNYYPMALKTYGELRIPTADWGIGHLNLSKKGFAGRRVSKSKAKRTVLVDRGGEYGKGQAGK